MGSYAARPDAETAEQAAARRNAGRFTLSEARQESVRLADLVKAGQTPRTAREAVQAERRAQSVETFEAMAAELVDLHREEWSPEWTQRAERLFASDDCAPLRPVPVRNIMADAVRAVVKSIEAKASKATGRSQSARPAFRLIGQVMRHAVNTGRAGADPTATLRGALKARAPEHHGILKKADLPDFYARLDAAKIDRPTSIALRLMAYTLARTKEIRQATWADFDLDEANGGADATWSVPAEKMKMKRPHVVPLAPQAVALLLELRAITGNGQYLFPNVRDPKRCMARSTLNAVIYRLGYAGKLSAHGFRGTASTILHEAEHDTMLIELCLAHTDGKVRAAYNHSTRLPARRAMLATYANILDGLARPGSNVVTFKGAA
jgi:integrase